MTSDAQLTIRGVTVVDPRDGSLRVGQDVRITGEQIVGVEPASDERDVPPAVQVIDAIGPVTAHAGAGIVNPAPQAWAAALEEPAGR